MTERRRPRPIPADHFGARLSEWRTRRRESQLDLAISANISQRHLSFVESGRTLPSRDMVVRLCEALDIPLRARNELLVAAGYAALYPERSLDIFEMEGVREALNRIVTHHEPYPAFVVDRRWRVIMSNASAARLVSALSAVAVAVLTALIGTRLGSTPTCRNLSWSAAWMRLAASTSETPLSSSVTRAIGPISNLAPP